jgi:hypothetical protein
MKDYRLKFIILATVFLTLVSCHKKLLMEKINEPHIAFGSGGGFTNNVKQFRLLEDGRIVEETKMQDSLQYKVVAEIGKRKAKECFNAVNKLKLDSLNFREPGNLYYFITVKSKDSIPENRVVWGSKDKPVSEEVKDFYKVLQDFLVQPKKEEKKQE